MAALTVFTTREKRKEKKLFHAELDLLPRKGEVVIWENNKYVVDIVVHLIDSDGQTVGVTLKKL